MHCKVMPNGPLLSMILRDVSWGVWYKFLRFRDSFFFSAWLKSTLVRAWFSSVCILDRLLIGDQKPISKNTLCQQRQPSFSFYSFRLKSSRAFCDGQGRGRGWYHILAFLGAAGSQISKREDQISKREDRAYLSNFGILPIAKMKSTRTSMI